MLVEVAVPVAGDVPGDDALPPIPWHLKLLGLAVAAYLLLRVCQGAAWVAHRL